MLLSIKKRFLFIHIAKTGGTSIRKALRKYRGGGLYTPAMVVTSQIDQLTRHRIGCKLARHAGANPAREMLPRDLFDSLFKFSIVRNPWDLQVSSYHHVRLDPEASREFETFEEFIRYKFREDRPYQFKLDIARRPQLRSLVDMDGNLLVDFVGRYENLEEDFAIICERIGIPVVPLPHLRRAGDRHQYREYYTEKLRDVVAEVYRPDIDTFGYSF